MDPILLKVVAGVCVIKTKTNRQAGNSDEKRAVISPLRSSGFGNHNRTAPRAFLITRSTRPPTYPHTHTHSGVALTHNNVSCANRHKNSNFLSFQRSMLLPAAVKCDFVVLTCVSRSVRRLSAPTDSGTSLFSFFLRSLPSFPPSPT